MKVKLRPKKIFECIQRGVLRIKLKCGLVCELTLRVNRHSNGQESPLCHHYVFYHIVWVIESYSMIHNLWASSFPMLMCFVVNEERGWLYKAPSSHLVWVESFSFVNIHSTCVFSVSYTLCLYSLSLSLTHTHTHTHTHIISLPLHRIYLDSLQETTN